MVFSTKNEKQKLVIFISGFWLFFTCQKKRVLHTVQLKITNKKKYLKIKYNEINLKEMNLIKNDAI